MHNNLERLLRSQEELAHRDNPFAQEMLDDLRQELLNSSQLTEQEVDRLLQVRFNLTRLEMQYRQQALIEVPTRRNY